MEGGVTLFEVLIVVAILAMVSSAIAVAALRYAERARTTHAKAQCATIRQAVQSYLFEGGADCPSLDALLAARLLEANAGVEDPWGAPYRISCEGEVTVRSSGPDRRGDTADDIVAPQPRAP